MGDINKFRPSPQLQNEKESENGSSHFFCFVFSTLLKVFKIMTVKKIELEFEILYIVSL